MSPPLCNLRHPFQDKGCHPTCFYTLGVVLFIYASELIGHVLVSPGKTRKLFKVKESVMFLCQSPCCNLTLYNVFLLSYLVIAVLLLLERKFHEDKGSVLFTAHVPGPETGPDTWQGLN